MQLLKRQTDSFQIRTLNNVATFEVSSFKLKCLTKQEAVNHIRCWDEWTPANELWQDPFGSFELAIGSVSALSGEGAVLWSLCGMVIRLWPLHSSLPVYLFPNGTDTGLRRTLLRSSETRDPWSGRLPVVQSAPRNPFRSKDSKCGLLHEDVLDTAWSFGYVPTPDTLALYTLPPPLPC